MASTKEKARRKPISTGEGADPANQPGGDNDTTAPQVSQIKSKHPELKAAALNALALGYHPVPLGNDKIPIIKWKKYQTEAPTAAEVEAWPWHQAEGVGILTGVGTGHPGSDVVDLDAYKPTYKPWPDDRKELPSHCVVKTASGGLQYYTAHVPGSTNSESLIAPCVDTRAKGGYVVIPPTPGYSYEAGSLETAAQAPAPPAWLAFVIRHPGRRGISVHVIPDDDHAGDDHAAEATAPKPPPTRTPTPLACRTILKSYVRVAAATPDSHKRNSEFFKAACAVAPYIIKSELNRADVEADFEALLRENEYIQDDGIDAFKRTFQSALDTAAKGEKPIQPYDPTIWTPDNLGDEDFPQPTWLIDSLLPEGGIIVLAGRPKVGKSWLALYWASLIKPSIYLPLEGAVPYRIKERTTALKLTGDNPLIPLDPPPPPMPEGLDALRRLCDGMNPQPRAIFIDPWVRFKPLTTTNSRAYETDYQHGADIANFATERDISIILVHHTRKRLNTSTESNPFEEVLGTTGVIGSADTSIILERPFTSPRGTLLLTSRYVEEYRKTMEFNGALWEVLGDENEFAHTDERNEILDLLRDVGHPLTAKEIAEETRKPYGAIRKLVSSMYNAGQLEKPKHGKYAPPGNIGNTVTNDHLSNACKDF